MLHNPSEPGVSRRFRFGITVKLTLWTLFGASLVLAFTQGYSEHFLSKIILSLVERGATNIVKSAALQFDDKLQSVMRSTENLAYAVEFGNWNEVSLLDLLESVVRENNEIYGATIAFEPYAFNSDFKGYAPYYCKTANGTELVHLAKPDYDYFNKDWYSIPRKTKKPHWSAPYFDAGGGDVQMVTYSRPMFQRKSPSASSQVKGIVTADLSLERLSQDISDLLMPHSRYAFMVSDKGAFLASPDSTLLFTESLGGFAAKKQSPLLTALAKATTSEQSGFVDVGSELSGVDSYCAFFNIPSTGWKLCALFAKSDLFKASNELRDKVAIIAIVGVLLLMAISYFIALSFTRPIKRLVEATELIGSGNLDFKVPGTTRRDEVGALAVAVDLMQTSLKEYIEKLTKATAEKERIESELAIAANIQRSMLPAITPTLGERQDLDVCAMMQPAREVGGDFYDFFFIDHDSVCIAIGDVSGKGVPAALFMSVTKYLVEATVSSEQKLDAALKQVNSLLLRNNEACMFVTIFLGILNMKTGSLTYANCGHNPPLMISPESGVSPIGEATGPILGVLDDPAIWTEVCQFQPNSIILTFTDGVTEAFNSSEELFGDDRLIRAVSSSTDLSVTGAINEVMKSLKVFCGDCPQTDDITMLALKFRPKTKTTDKNEIPQE